MWNPFKKKSASGRSGQSEPATAKANRVDDLANALQKQGRIAELEAELMKLDSSSLSLPEQESWWHLYGIVAFQGGRDGEALGRFQQAFEKFPGSAQIRFSLGQQYIRAKEIDKGFELFRTCPFPAVPREYSLAEARYAYLWNRYEDGLSFVRPFLEAYKQLRILDDHFLYVRGLPFFGRWWSYLASLSILNGDLTELDTVTDFVSENCHDYDFDYLQAELKSYRQDKPELLIDALEGRLRKLPDGNYPSGYIRMNLAVAKARTANTADVARTILAGVTLTDRDFSWLEDIRTLATAEAAHRFGASAIEQENIEVFLSRQPMLFEPDIALNFHLLRYQELLKVRVAVL